MTIRDWPSCTIAGCELIYFLSSAANLGGIYVCVSKAFLRACVSTGQLCVSKAFLRMCVNRSAVCVNRQLCVSIGHDHSHCSHTHIQTANMFARQRCHLIFQSSHAIARSALASLFPRIVALDETHAPSTSLFFVSGTVCADTHAKECIARQEHKHTPTVFNPYLYTFLIL